MISFDEEIKKFKPAPTIDEAEELIRTNAMTDIKDVIAGAIKSSKENTGAQDGDYKQQ